MTTTHEKLSEPLVIHRGDVDALMFDLDGTLTDNTELHQMAWRLFAEKHGKSFTDEWFHKNCTGQTSRNIISQLFGETTKDQQEAYFAERFAIYEDIFRKSGKEIEGLTPLLHQVGEAGIKLVLVTSGSPPTRKLQLDHLGLSDTFELTIGSEHVENTKPHPEPYLRAAQALGLAAQRCLAFEDSKPGVASADDAGMPVVGVLSTHTADELSQTVATITDYTEVRLAA